jgi:hypothetical protein
MAARYSLLEHGVRAVSPGSDTRAGSWYELDHVRYDCTVYISDGTAPPSRPAALLDTVVYAGSYPVSTWLAPAGCPKGRLSTPAAAGSGASAVGYATTWVSYRTLLDAIRSRPLIRAIIIPARKDVEIKFRDGLEWHAFYPPGAQGTLQRMFDTRHVRMLFVPAHPRRSAKPAASHPLRLIAAGFVALIAILGVGVLLHRRRRARAAAAR